jgi:hypothetical protein
MAGLILTREERVALTFIAHNDPKDGFVRRTWLEFKAAICGLLQRTRTNGWIPVSERLPAEESQCIVWHKRSGECRIAFRYEGNWYEGSILITANVTHWMPLPEPPEAK